MRLAAYAGASIASAAAVVVYAFNQRSNFYSACVYLAQSNLCLMILTNLVLFLIASVMFGLQRLFYGRLRPIEIEQLYEKGWFAVTETCLAMTIFREEVGAWFLVMFVALLVGKVWGWIGEGRVEILEQQPPTNPRLFHIRLSFSLAISLLYDIWLMVYIINTVIQQARPNMMVMFLFEFAVLTTSSTSTALRYCISLIEASIIKKQTKERLEVRRSEVRAEREQILRQRAAAAAEGGESTAEATPATLPSEDDVDEIDIEVPGWEAKGQWILSLDLATDFFKLGIYTAFFFILMAFYGLPIHIMRDLFLTARSFIKRLSAFIKYRRATQDMARYPDATVEEIQREDTCIICREEMTPWSVTNPAEVPAEAADRATLPQAGRPANTLNERTRPKKLPCGHVLHLGCLKSWLERQQVCPTCRRPVVDSTQAGRTDRPGNGVPAPNAAGQPPVPGAAAPGVQHHNAHQNRNQNQGNMRVLGIGPLRFAFGQANMNEVAQVLNRQDPAPQNGGAGRARMYGLEFGFGRPRAPRGASPPANGTQVPLQIQLMNIEQQILQEINDLQASQQELQLVQLLQQELNRLRQMHGTANPQASGGTTVMPQMQLPLPLPLPFPNIAPFNANPTSMPGFQRHGASPGVSAIPAGSADLPPGVTIPDGWSLLPLQRIDSPVPASANNNPVSTRTAPLATQDNPVDFNVPNPAPTWNASLHNNTPPPPVAPSSISGVIPPQPVASLEPASTVDAAEITEATVPDSMSASNTAPGEQETAVASSAALPNWGTSQAFRGPSLDADNGSSTVQQSQAGSEEPTSSTKPPIPAAPTITAPLEGQASPSGSGTNAEVDDEKGTAQDREKGKAKAATVEEDSDEA